MNPTEHLDKLKQFPIALGNSCWASGEIIEPGKIGWALNADDARNGRAISNLTYTKLCELEAPPSEDDSLELQLLKQARQGEAGGDQGQGADANNGETETDQGQGVDAGLNDDLTPDPSPQAERGKGDGSESVLDEDAPPTPKGKAKK